MLNKLFGKAAKDAALEAKGVVESLESKEDVKEKLEVATVELSKFEEVVAELSSLKEAMTTLSAEYETAKAELAVFVSEKESAIVAAKEAKLSVRKEKLVSAVGTEKADALLAVAGDMEDAAFEAVVSALQMNVETEEKSAMFKETGVTSEAEVDSKPVHFNKFFKNK